MWISTQSSAASAAANQTAPEILSSNPAIGASEIDPGLTAITVTFDQVQIKVIVALRVFVWVHAYKTDMLQKAWVDFAQVAGVGVWH